MKESQIQSQIMQYLALKGFPYKISTTGIYDPTRKVFRKNYHKGVPDIIFLHRDGVMFFEVKKKKPKSGLLKDEQGLFQDRCRLLNIKHYVVDSLDDVMEVV